MKKQNVVFLLAFFVLSGTVSAQKSPKWMSGFNSLWNLIADTTRRSIEGVTKATGIDLFGKSGLMTKSAVPTPPAIFDLPPPDRLPQEPNFAELGHSDSHMSIDHHIPIASKRGVATRSTEVTCTQEFASLPGHTMCMNDKSDVSESGVSELDKILIVRHHNRLRGQVEPPATDLVKLTWDERLARVAQKWANQCEAGHDSERNIPSLGMTVGQNVAGGYRSWKKAIQQWWDEIDLWKYGVEPDSYLGRGGWMKIGHFTQMAQNQTFLVGCGFAVCENSLYKRYYVCDYANGQSNIAVPYTRGPRCSKCPHSCVNGQCDCKGLICYNGGTLDPDTCTCTCTKLYSGQSCEILQCPAEDSFVCGRDWPKSYCDRFYNVPDECPYMCGKCKSKFGGGAVSKPVSSSFTSSFGCTFSGRRASLEECSKYGDHGQDIQACATRGGNLNCGHCTKFYNVKRDMCPVMCGLCDPPCGGKMCKNGGELNIATCQCTCVPPYEGNTCEKAKCPPQDKTHCRWWPKSHCTTYFNVPQDCPWMCGVCH